MKQAIFRLIEVHRKVVGICSDSLLYEHANYPHDAVDAHSVMPTR